MAQKTPGKTARKAPAKTAKKPKAPVLLDRYGDPLPEGALLRLGSERLRLDNRPAAIAFSPDGKLVAGGDGLYGKVYLWDAATGAPVKCVSKVQRVQGELNGAIDIGFSPDGRWLATIGSHFLRVWDLSNDVERITDGAQYRERIAFSPDSRLLAASRHRAPIFLYSTAACAKIREIEAPDWCEDIAFSPDGTLLAASGVDKKDSKISLVELRDVQSGELRLALRPEAPLAKEGSCCRPGLGFSRDGRSLVVLFPGEALCVYELPSGARKERRPWPGFSALWEGWPKLRFSGDLETLVACDWRDPTRVYDVSSGAERFLLPSTSMVAFSPDGEVIAASDASAVRLWATRLQSGSASPKELLPFEGHRGDVGAIGFSPDGRRLFTRAGGRLLGWDSQSGARVAEHEGSYVALSEDTRSAVLSQPTGETQTLALVDLETGQKKKDLEGEGKYGRVQISPDGARIYATDERVIRFWSTKNGARLGEIAGHQSSPYAYALSRSELLASASWEDAIWLWDMSGAKPRRLRAFSGRSYCYCRMAFSPDDSLLASGCRDHGVRVWEVEGAGLRHLLKGHTRTPRSLAFSPDGALLATADELSIRLWEVKTGKMVSVRKVGATALRFSPAGDLLASGHLGASLLWELKQLLAG